MARDGMDPVDRQELLYSMTAAAVILVIVSLFVVAADWLIRRTLEIGG